jgi:5,10-methylenetetrahydromethanopterin reductase
MADQIKNATEVCVTLMPPKWPEIAEIAAAAERAGISDIGIVDSPLVSRDLYVSCVACLLQTSRLRVRSAVTNPVTRHPSVTASGALSLSELAPGRVGIGIATGDSAVWGVGLKPARISELCEYITALKALLRGEEAIWRSSSFQGHWKNFDPSLAPPVHVACSGPKTLKAAAQIADGLIIAEMGYTPADIARVRALIEEGCAEVGRDPEELDLWWGAELKFSDSTADATATGIATSSAWLTVGGTAGKGIPEGFAPKLRQLHADSYDLETYAGDRGEHLAERARKLGLYDWLVERSARLYGTPDDVRSRMDELRALGIEKWYLWPEGDDIFSTINSLGTIIQCPPPASGSV